MSNLIAKYIGILIEILIKGVGANYAVINLNRKHRKAYQIKTGKVVAIFMKR